MKDTCSCKVLSDCVVSNVLYLTQFTQFNQAFSINKLWQIVVVVIIINAMNSNNNDQD